MLAERDATGGLDVSEETFDRRRGGVMVGRLVGSVVGVEDVEFLAPFKFYRNEPRTVTIRVQLRPDGDGGDRIVADCSLLGCRARPSRR